MCSYRERKDALTESANAILPKARKRSYRERECDLTESVKALLPRVQGRSYRERPPPLRTSDKQAVRRTRSSTHICSHMRAVSSFAWGRYIRPWNRAYLPYSPRKGLGGARARRRGLSPREAPGPTHDLARMLLPLDLRGYYFISQGALAYN